ncbi:MULTISPECIES: DeoR/GlpR family DNA-binding transcription regulator [unclassified Pedobacter]|uniref:DeoR/GlpR family DNA-binding transcription regulator n=1 Tax=unclassified Pedobacter TaxID=2628915 RepID=UPI001420585A|nr:MULTISPECIES: DeoR/GlpR family DNA-binding transcription regulator [unclassified Pedobacter]NII81420.1 DeoR/GlpR family transcriptional regulator of sugar metabolism [Pedobacter sp. SG908]NMN35425.1 DeoR/GlpR family transcriptional regulator of sugar metabolism [Pedobacter sp. SG918]
MVKEERLQIIINTLDKDSKVRLDALSALLNVSEDTVRRDIKELDSQGLLRAVRGGAISRSPIPQHYRDREKYNQQHKQAIANKALQFLKDGQVVFFDGGTSVVALATILPTDLKITIITNSFPVANILEDHPSAEVIFAGGRLQKTAFTTIGQETIDTFKKVRADICMLGICSLHHSMGITSIIYEDAQLNNIMISQAQKTIALSALEKINTVEPYYVCPVDDVDVIITETDPDNAILVPYKNLGIEVI